eukprot:gene10236-476_t
MGGWRGTADADDTPSMRRVGRLQDAVNTRYASSHTVAGRRDDARRWGLLRRGWLPRERAVAARAFDVGTRALERMHGVLHAGDEGGADAGVSPSQAEPSALSTWVVDRNRRKICRGSADGLGRFRVSRDHTFRRGAVRFPSFKFERKVASLGCDLRRRVQEYTVPNMWRLHRAGSDPSAFGPRLAELVAVPLLVVQLVEIGMGRGAIPADAADLGGRAHTAVFDAAAGEGAPPLYADGVFDAAFPVPIGRAPRSAAAARARILAGVGGASLLHRIEGGDFDARRHGW